MNSIWDIDGVDTLYDLDPTEFVAARGALAKSLKTAGDKEAAQLVTALRKPSKLAWAVNQAIRSDPAGVRRLVKAGDDLRDAQAALGSGGDATALRKASEHRRRAARALADRVDAALSDEALAMLEAAAVSDEVRDRLTGGRFETAVEANSDFGGFTLTSTPTTAARTDPRERKQLQQRLTKAEHQHERAVRRVREAEDHAARAAKELDEARASLEAAEVELAAARDELGMSE